MEKVLDIFGNEIKTGDFIVSTSSADGIHFASMGWVTKVIGFKDVVYESGGVSHYVLCASRFPIENRGKPFEISLDNVMKTTLHNYLVCQKRMLQSDKEHREKPPIYINQRKPGGRVSQTGRPNGIPDWMRPHIPYKYVNNEGGLTQNYPQKRRRKTRKIRRFVSEIDAKAMNKKWYEDNKEKIERNRPRIITEGDPEFEAMKKSKYVKPKKPEVIVWK